MFSYDGFKEKCHHRFTYLDTWSPTGGSVLGSYRSFRMWGLAGQSHRALGSFESSSPSVSSSLLLCLLGDTLYDQPALCFGYLLWCLPGPCRFSLCNCKQKKLSPKLLLIVTLSLLQQQRSNAKMMCVFFVCIQFELSCFLQSC